ncbi:MAG: glycosyltransferase family 87 protein [Pirellulales bacterium]|nr:glycosyltransferase family 87 protein [Pirellulales bacterium]
MNSIPATIPLSATKAPQESGLLLTLANRRWGVGLLLLVIAIWGWTDVRRRARTSATDPLVHKTDVTVYTQAGAALFDGRPPYEVTNPRGWHYLYPPLFAIGMAPLSLLPTTEQALVWFGVSCLCLWGACAETRRLYQWAAEIPRGFLYSSRKVIPGQVVDYRHARLTNEIFFAAGIALVFPVLNCLQRGQVGVPLVYLLLLGTRLALTAGTVHQLFLAGLVLALPVAIKLTPLLPVAVLAGGMLVRDLAQLLHWSPTPPRTNRENHGQQNQTIQLSGGILCVSGILGLAVWFLLVPGLILGQEKNLGLLQTWYTRVVSNQDVGTDNDFNARSLRNQSFANGLRRMGNWWAYCQGTGPDDRVADDLAHRMLPLPMENPAADLTIKVVVGGVLMLLAAATLRLGMRAANQQPEAESTTIHASSARLDWLAVFGLACTATVLVSPLSWGHHYVICWPAMVFVPLFLASCGSERLARSLAWSAAGLLLAHYVILDYAGRVGLLGLGMTVWYGVGVLAVLRGGGRGQANTSYRLGQPTTAGE